MPIKTKAEILTDVNAFIQDAPAGNITPSELRSIYTDIVDTMATGTPIYTSGGGNTSPSGATRSIQFNNGGVFGGDPNFIITANSGLVVPTSGSFGATVAIRNGSGIQFQSNGAILDLKPPTGLTASYSLRLPATLGSANQILALNSSTTELTFVDQTGGGGGTGIPGGPNRSIQFNNAGSFSGVTGFNIDLNGMVTITSSTGTGLAISAQNNLWYFKPHATFPTYSVLDIAGNATAGLIISFANTERFILNSTTLRGWGDDWFSLGAVSQRVSDLYTIKGNFGVGQTSKALLNIISTGAVTGVYAIAASGQNEDILNLRSSDFVNNFCVGATGLLTSRAGISVNQSRLGGTIKSSFATTIAATSVTTLLSYNVASGMLRSGDYIEVSAFGTFGNPNDDKNIQFLFGNTILDLRPNTNNSGAWSFDSVIGAASSSGQNVMARLISRSGVAVAYSGVSNTNGIQTLILQGSGNGFEPIVIKGYTVKWHPSNP